MAENLMLEAMNGGSSVNGSKYSAAAIRQNQEEKKDTSIFSSVQSETEESADVLYEQLEAIQAENGAILDGWNTFKEKVGIGTSADKCEQAIEQYKNGEITFEEAQKTIEEFGNKQDNSLNLFSNIASSTVSILAVTLGTAAGICAAPFTAGASLGLMAAGFGIAAGAGAATKASFKAIDRATNDIEGDALDGKQLAKDAATGAITGAIAGATMGNGSAAENLSASIVKSATKSAKTGVITGSVSGAANYSIDCAFDENKDFNFGEFALTTAQNAAVGGVVGGIMGGSNGALKSLKIVKNGGKIEQIITETGEKRFTNTTSNDIIANATCSAEYKIVNDRVRAMASAVVA